MARAGRASLGGAVLGSQDHICPSIHLPAYVWGQGGWGRGNSDSRDSGSSHGHLGSMGVPLIVKSAQPSSGTMKPGLGRGRRAGQAHLQAPHSCNGSHPFPKGIFCVT